MLLCGIRFRLYTKCSSSSTPNVNQRRVGVCRVGGFMLKLEFQSEHHMWRSLQGNPGSGNIKYRSRENISIFIPLGGPPTDTTSGRKHKQLFVLSCFTVCIVGLLILTIFYIYLWSISIKQ